MRLLMADFVPKASDPWFKRCTDLRIKVEENQSGSQKIPHLADKSIREKRNGES
jgi:hypothetical protein